jgi:hypothetical protein
MHKLTIEFDPGIESPDPDEREAAVISALLEIAESASRHAGLPPCCTFGTLAVATITMMAEHGHLVCAAGAAELIGIEVAERQRQAGRDLNG